MRRTLRLLIVVALLVGGCAQNQEPERPDAGSTSAEAFPVTLEVANGSVEIPAQPRRIVSLSPTATEMLFAIGAGEQVVAVDDQSTYPPEAPITKLSGLEPNAEAVIGYEPDLVVASDDHGSLTKALDAVGVPFLIQPAADTLDDTYAEIEQLGEATGNADAAADVVESMQTDIEKAIEGLPEFDAAPTYYHELDDTYFSVTSKTFIGQVYDLMGLRNVADAAKGAGSGYPQLSAEFIIDADPDFIFLADTVCCGQSAKTVAQRPGWDQTAAVENHHVVELNDDVASRWGPRVAEFVEIIAEHISQRD